MNPESFHLTFGVHLIYVFPLFALLFLIGLIARYINAFPDL